MRALYTEFSFGFGIAHEIQNILHSISLCAPVFPSLLDERDVGWDVNFRISGRSLFLQFKRSDALTRRTAKQWPVFNSSFYRFPVYRRIESPQHNLLVRLAKSQPHVYYCAPLFYKDGDFNSYFMQKSLLDYSLFIPCKGLPELTDDDQHYIAYNATGRAYFCSQPSQIPDADLGRSFVHQFATTLGFEEMATDHTITMKTLGELWDHMFNLVAQSGHFHRQALSSVTPDLNEPTSLIRAIRLVSRTYFGAEWMVITRSISDGIRRQAI